MKTAFDEQESASFDGKGLHVLAVDDHLPNLIVLEALLGELNVTTTKAQSGQEALGILQQRIEQGQQPFDLIFMDIQMPVMSGVRYHPCDSFFRVDFGKSQTLAYYCPHRACTCR